MPDSCLCQRITSSCSYEKYKPAGCVTQTHVNEAEMKYTAYMESAVDTLSIRNPLKRK